MNMITQLSFKDGEEEDYDNELSFSIKMASNGYILDIMGEEDETEVYVDKNQLLERLKGLL